MTRSKRPPEGVEGTPPTELKTKATRRRFSAEYKRSFLLEADACQRPGELGALLPREGLWSSHLNTWRLKRERGERRAREEGARDR